MTDPSPDPPKGPHTRLISIAADLVRREVNHTTGDDGNCDRCGISCQDCAIDDLAAERDALRDVLKRVIDWTDGDEWCHKPDGLTGVRCQVPDCDWCKVHGEAEGLLNAGYDIHEIGGAS